MQRNFLLFPKNQTADVEATNNQFVPFGSFDRMKSHTSVVGLVCLLSWGCGEEYGKDKGGRADGSQSDGSQSADGIRSPDAAGNPDNRQTGDAKGDAVGTTDARSGDAPSSIDGRAPGVPMVPTVTANQPSTGATAVPVNARPSARFSEPMDRATLGMTTFTLVSGATPVSGSVLYSDSLAVFLPADPLPMNTTFTATITTGAKSAAGVAMAAPHSWTFTTGTTVVAEKPVNLGTAGNYVILSKSGISTVPTSAVTGNIAVSPIKAGAITGFGLTADATNVFATSPQVTGQVFASDYAAPTPSNLTTAIGDMELAFTDAAGRAPNVTELGAGNIGGMTLAPGVYKWGTGVLIPTNLTLNGSATDVWIFQVAKDVTVSSGTKVFLTGGALAKNVFWQVSGQVIVGTTAHMEGVILSQTSVTFRTGSSLDGRILAQTAVDIDGTRVVQPAP